MIRSLGCLTLILRRERYLVLHNHAVFLYNALAVASAFQIFPTNLDLIRCDLRGLPSV